MQHDPKVLSLSFSSEETLVKAMSDREHPPTDLFDAVCRLDDLADWLEDSWPDEAADVKAASEKLKGYLVICLKDDPR